MAGRGLAQAAGVVSLPCGGPVCGAAFCSEDEHALALAGADCCAYLYDLRRLTAPVQVRVRFVCRRVLKEQQEDLGAAAHRAREGGVLLGGPNTASLWAVRLGVVSLQIDFLPQLGARVGDAGTEAGGTLRASSTWC